MAGSTCSIRTATLYFAKGLVIWTLRLYNRPVARNLPLKRPIIGDFPTLLIAAKMSAISIKNRFYLAGSRGRLE